MNTKERILELLESSRGCVISGEYMAERINVTRSAVWKAIKELEKDGYMIKAATNRGYSLSEDSDILSVQGMLPFLSRKESAESIFIHRSLESTNKTAKEMALSGSSHGTAIFADSQTGGRGRHGRAFFSPPGHGIYMSLILHPMQMRFETPTIVTAFAAVSVCEAIESVSTKKAGIKWVNDVFIDGKKVCGILTEAVTQIESGSIQWIVVGIGINFKKPEAGFPEDIRHIAGSVFMDGKPSVTRNRLAAEIVNRIATPEATHDSADILGRYKSHMFILGKRITVHAADEPYEAMAVDIDNIGRLIVRKDDGETLALSAWEVSVRW